MGHVQLSIIASFGLSLASCNEPGEMYRRPVAEVHELLRTVEVPLYVFGNSTDTDASVDASDPSKVVWKVTSDGIPLMHFTASLRPDEGSNTRVIVDIDGDGSNRFGDIRSKLLKAKEIRNFYLASMTEAVDSTLDGRAYDLTATYGAMMSAAAANANRIFPQPTAKDRPSRP